MSDSYEVVLTIQCDQARTYEAFVQELLLTGLVHEYELAQIPYPELSFRQNFLDRITKHGLSSFLSMTVAMEDIASSTLTSNQLESMVSRFVQLLFPATRLVIIDPYFYSPNQASDTDKLLQRLLGPQASALVEVYIVTEHGGTMKASMHAAIQALAPGAQVHEVRTPVFHDRFWINPDAGTGIVMGTSLSGLGRRVALVDKLSADDVQEVLVELRRLSAGI